MPPRVDSALVDLCHPLREALTHADYTADTLLEVLGPDVHAALGRSEPVPVRRASRDAGELGTLIRLFLLADDCPRAEVAAALAPLDLDEAVAAGLLDVEGDQVRAALDVRPLDLGSGDRWIVSDLDGSMRRRTIEADHVLGVGHASLSLLRATPIDPVESALDLGTGCGVQAVHAADYAQRVTATDINPRALSLTAATAALNGLSFELTQGPWTTPVAGRRFDRIVSNPPFVVGPARVEHTYRDSGLDLDGASERVVSSVPDLLAPDGVATLLASWVHVDGQDWRERVASWLPDYGVDAWILQRDVADPALYVGTWLRDAGMDPVDPQAQHRAEQWLAHFSANSVAGIGFGHVFLRRIDGPTEVVAEEASHAYDAPLGAEVPGYFRRSQWLREHPAHDGRLRVHPATALEQVSVPGADGWERVVTRLHRGDGPRWQHEVDDAIAALVGGIRPDGPALDTLIDVVALAFAGDAPTPQWRHDAGAAVDALIRHGLVEPA
ncbi:methyltransferase [Skermania sp. ID1734]|uniref:DUF7782 domain-containing protein n=1 Tax=Skermania sp. ID1734 TaxID=2597516 RepID=UPI00117D93D7|nr:methyltransferase [Skermania sp. ID1734]TSD96040.1 methyltransferase [Skermania sp. ID1734]